MSGGGGSRPQIDRPWPWSVKLRTVDRRCGWTQQQHHGRSAVGGGMIPQHKVGITTFLQPFGLVAAVVAVGCSCRILLGFSLAFFGSDSFTMVTPPPISYTTADDAADPPLSFQFIVVFITRNFIHVILFGVVRSLY